jgi:hypothetical protein
MRTARSIEHQKKGRSKPGPKRESKWENMEFSFNRGCPTPAAAPCRDSGESQQNPRRFSLTSRPPRRIVWVMNTPRPQPKQPPLTPFEQLEADQERVAKAFPAPPPGGLAKVALGYQKLFKGLSPEDQRETARVLKMLAPKRWSKETREWWAEYRASQARAQKPIP